MRVAPQALPHRASGHSVRRDDCLCRELRARVADFSERKAIVKCTVSSRGLACAEAEVIAVRMPA